MLIILLYTCAVQRVRVHNIQPGETLWEISRAYQVPLETLLRINRIEDASLIRPGDEIYIPITASGSGEVRRLTESSHVDIPQADPDSYPELPQTVREFSPAGQTPDFAPVWPARGEVVSSFKPSGSPTDNGLMLRFEEAVEIVAAEAGEVKLAGLWDSLPELGKIIIIAHDQEFVTVYAQLAEVEVAAGQTVRQGDKIGVAGDIDMVEGKTVYFEIRYNLEPRDPILFLGEP